MKLKDAEQLALELMKVHNLRGRIFKQGWKFGFHNKKMVAGSCYHIKKIICLSRYFVSLNNKSAVLDVILHEIAHALVGYSNHHNHIWKAKSLEIGSKGERTSYYNSPKEGYVWVCPHCSNEVVYYRKIKADKSCSKCSDKYSKKYKLIYKGVRK